MDLILISLNDREERVFEAKPRSPAGAPAGDRGPLVLGLIAAIIPLALVVAFLGCYPWASGPVKDPQ